MAYILVSQSSNMNDWYDIKCHLRFQNHNQPPLNSKNNGPISKYYYCILWRTSLSNVWKGFKATQANKMCHSHCGLGPWPLSRSSSLNVDLQGGTSILWHGKFTWYLVLSAMSDSRTMWFYEAFIYSKKIIWLKIPNEMVMLNFLFSLFRILFLLWNLKTNDTTAISIFAISNIFSYLYINFWFKIFIQAEYWIYLYRP